MRTFNALAIWMVLLVAGASGCRLTVESLSCNSCGKGEKTCDGADGGVCTDKKSAGDSYGWSNMTTEQISDWLGAATESQKEEYNSWLSTRLKEEVCAAAVESLPGIGTYNPPGLFRVNNPENNYDGYLATVALWPPDTPLDFCDVRPGKKIPAYSLFYKWEYYLKDKGVPSVPLSYVKVYYTDNESGLQKGPLILPACTRSTSEGDIQWVDFTPFSNFIGSTRWTVELELFVDVCGKDRPLALDEESNTCIDLPDGKRGWEGKLKKGRHPGCAMEFKPIYYTPENDDSSRGEVYTSRLRIVGRDEPWTHPVYTE